MSTLQSASIPAYRAVIKECIERDPSGPVIGLTLDAVLHERFPIGPGGAGHANRKAQARIRGEIEAFYAPTEHSEPTGLRS